MTTYKPTSFQEKQGATTPKLKFAMFKMPPWKYPCCLLAFTVSVCLVAGLISVLQSNQFLETPSISTRIVDLNDENYEIANVPPGCQNTNMAVNGGRFYCPHPSKNPQNETFLMCNIGLVPSNGAVFQCIQSRWVPALEESGCVAAVALVVGGDTGGENDKVELLSLEGNCNGRMPGLPRPRVWHSSVLIGGPYLRSGSSVLTCGGIEGPNHRDGQDQDISNCIELDLSRSDVGWRHHSNLYTFHQQDRGCEWGVGTHHSTHNPGRFRHNSVEVLGRVVHIGGGNVPYMEEEQTTEILDTTKPFINQKIVNYFYNSRDKEFSKDVLGIYIIPEIAGVSVPHKYYKLWRPTYINQSTHWGEYNDWEPTDCDVQPQPGEKRSKPILWSCSVRISEDTILITGGYSSLKETWLYNTTTGRWKWLQGTNMIRGRYRHACAVIRRKGAEVWVLVSGGAGIVRTSDTLKSSELLKINLRASQSTWKWEVGENMREGREGHGMVVLGRKVVAIGGRGMDRKILDSMEVYRVDRVQQNKWETSGVKLKHPRWGFSVVAVPNTKCNAL